LLISPYNNTRKMIKNLKKILNDNKLFFLVLFILLLIKYLLITRLDNSHFINSYNFFTDDGYDWIATGIRLGSENITYRNPGLPAIIWLLSKLNLLFLIPLINQIAFLVLLFFLYKSIKYLTKNNNLAKLIILFIFFNSFIQLFANYVLADIYAIAAITAALYFILKDKLYFAAFALGVSMLFQNFGYFLFIAFGIYVLFNEFNSVEYKKLSINKIIHKLVIPIKIGMIGLFLPMLWHLFKLIKFGDPLYTKIIQFQLVQPHLDSLWFYSVGSLSVFGLCFFFGLFAIILLKKRVDLHKFGFILSSIFITIVFWIILYNWNDRRFLLYLFPYVFIGLAFILNKIKKEILIIPILLLSIYPAYFATSSQFDLPLNHKHSIIFDYEVDQQSQAIKLDTDFKVSSSDSSLVTTILPSALFFIKDMASYQEINNYTAIEYTKIAESYNIDSNSFCFTEGREYSPYLLNSFLLIYKDKSFYIDFNGNVLSTDDC
ncbi:hypothetical protein KC678_01335, partial [Candidatus Dojkabacteria bacterium]|nr:hypothetical protein [Candidatus Dojkabacteria bacterium]